MRSSNAGVVLQTLVPQARAIFQLLAQAQLAEQAEEDGSEGPATSRAMQHTHTHTCAGLATCWLQWCERRIVPALFFQAAAASELMCIASARAVLREGCERGGTPWPGKQSHTSVVCSLELRQMAADEANSDKIVSSCLMVLLHKQGRLGSCCNRQLI